MKRIKKPAKALPKVSPFLTLELKTDQQDEKSNDISPGQNGLEPITHSATGKGGSRPFLGTIRLDEVNSPNKFNYIVKRPLKAVGFCATELCHQDSFLSSGNPYSITVVDDGDCATGLCHQRKKIVEKTFPDDSLKPLIQARRKPLNGDANPVGQCRLKTVGLTVRGRSFYAKWKVPKRLQHIVGKTGN